MQQGLLSQSVANIMYKNRGWDSVELDDEEKNILNKMDALKKLGVSTWLEHRQHLMYRLWKSHKLTFEAISDLFKVSSARVAQLVKGFVYDKVFNPTHREYEENILRAKSRIND